MKKIGKVLVIRHLWFSDKMVALRKIYSREHPKKFYCSYGGI
ncbi:hypothetical protein [Segatella hominis]|nr:hypothetical protein [Segatella hominis]